MLVRTHVLTKGLWMEFEDYPNIGDKVNIDFGRGHAIKRIHTDKSGKRYFVWDNQRVYLDYLGDYTLKKIQDMIDNNEFVTDNELALAILNEGVDKVRFICPCKQLQYSTPFGFGVYSDKKEDVVCKVVEDRYKVNRQYKITLVPEDGNAQHGYEHYYLSDFLNLIKKGIIKMVV